MMNLTRNIGQDVLIYRSEGEMNNEDIVKFLKENFVSGKIDDIIDEIHCSVYFEIESGSEFSLLLPNEWLCNYRVATC